MVDILVLGNSLQEHGVKAEKLLCINDDTMKSPIAQLMKAFWQFVPVKHVALPKHLRGTEQSRLQGVYSKLQTVALFASGDLKQRRFLQMDADMLARANLDDVFAYAVPAGVMRGDADSCMYEARPAHTYFHSERTMKRGDSHPAMKGGINGGLVLFEPDEETYQKMVEELHAFRPTTRMAEQEFLSLFFGRRGAWHAMHKKYNFQLHQLWFGSPEAPPGQVRPSSFSYMVEHPDEIRIFHYSADQKPSEILINDMSSVQGWLSLEEHLADHIRHMRKEHGGRNENLDKHPEWIPKIEKLQREAYLEWYDAWKRTYVNTVAFVLETAYNKMRCTTKDDGDYVQCPTCGAEWHTSDIQEQPCTIRDHLLFNCHGLASEIKIPVKHQTNLLTFFFVPCGAQVESKLLYLAEVYEFYVVAARSLKRKLLPPLPLNASQQPQILLPLYSIPSFVLATTEDRGVDASTVTGEEVEVTLKAWQRRYQRALTTLLAPDNIFCWRNNPKRAAEWLQTLNTAAEAGKWLIEHEQKSTAFCQSKAKASTSASSSSEQPMMMAPTPKEPATAGRQHVTPPWRRPPSPQPKARPSRDASRTSVPPPPPPPPRR